MRKKILKKKANQNCLRPEKDFPQDSALEIRSEIESVKDGKKINSDVQKMDRAPCAVRKKMSRIGSDNQSHHKIKTNCSERHKPRLETRMKRNENIFPAKRNKFMKKKARSVNSRENKSLK